MHHGIGHMVGGTPLWDLLLLASGGHHWRPVQTCSIEALTPSPTHPHTTIFIILSKNHEIDKIWSEERALLLNSLLNVLTTFLACK